MKDYLDAATQALFERGGIRHIFDHARNAVVATIIVAAGMDTAKRDDAASLLGLANPSTLSYIVIAIGLLLITLNFLDGFRKLKKLRWHIALQVALGVAYVFFSIRIIQVIVFFRTHSC